MASGWQGADEVFARHDQHDRHDESLERHHQHDRHDESLSPRSEPERRHSSLVIAPEEDDDSSAESTMPPSGAETPVHGGGGEHSKRSRRQKKHIAWILPSDEGGDAPAEQSSSAAGHDREQEQEPEQNEEREEEGDAGDQQDTADLERQATHEELRRGVHEIFTKHPPSSRGSPHESPPESRRGGRAPKSALRKGDHTPTSPPILIHEPSEQAERKNRSAADAAARAAKHSRSLDVTPETSPNRKRKHKSPSESDLYHEGDTLKSGQSTPEKGDFYDYIPRPYKYRVAGLSAMRMLDKVRPSHSRRSSFDDSSSPSGASTPSERPTGWFRNPHGGSTASISSLVRQSAASLGGPGYHDIGRGYRPGPEPRSSSSAMVETIGNRISSSWKHSKQRKKENALVTKHVQETFLRQRYLLKLCKALMQYGAPTHRLEEYMKMSARVLDMEAQFLYIPGCMICSFDDSNTHTTEVRLVRVSQGVDLGKLKDTHDIYKHVVHDLVGVEDAAQALEEIIKAQNKFKDWFRVVVYGLASVCVGPFAFKARLIDLPIAFALGCLLGALQLLVAPQSELYSNVFEIAAVIITSFLARAFGSINGGNLFCFSALAQSSIALILPGYTVLCGSLELQSRSIVAGSVRLVYAIIYSLFIGFGLTIGTGIYGAINPTGATSETTCRNPMPEYWFFFFVPAFAFCLTIVNQAKWKQMPVMLVIAFAGYLVNYFSSQGLSGASQISSTLGAVTISVLANTYSRLGVSLDVASDKVYAWFQKQFVAAPPGDGDSLEKLDSAELEKQVTVEEPQTRFGAVVARLSRLVHNPKRSASPPPTSSSSEAGSTHSGTDHRDSHHHHDHHHSGDIRANGLGHGRGRRRSKTTGRRDSRDEQAPRVNHALAAAAMLPAIFVLVPSGLSVSGSLVAGLQTANQLVGNTTTTLANGSTVTSSAVTAGNFQNNISFTVGYSVVQVAIGITVGLFIGSILVYPIGKSGKLGSRKGMRSGLFSF